MVPPLGLCAWCAGYLIIHKQHSSSPYVMSNNGGGGSSGPNSSGGHQGIRITLPNPNAHPKPSSPSRAGPSGPPYPFTSNAHSNTQSKTLPPNKTLTSPFPSPAHILSQNQSHQDPYTNSPSNFSSFQYPTSNNVNPSSYPSPTSSPESSPRTGAREVPYTLPSLNVSLPSINSNNQSIPPPSIRNHNASSYPSSTYSNPISFVNSNPAPSRPPKDSSGSQFSSSPSSSFSAPLPRHINTPPPTQSLTSPPASPTHDGFSHPSAYSRRYPSPTHPGFTPAGSKYSNVYMEPPHPTLSGQHAATSKPSNTPPNLQRAYSPHLGPAPVLPASQGPITSSQAPPSPAHPSSSHATSPHASSHSYSTNSHSTSPQSTSPGSHPPPSILASPRRRSPSIPPSPMRQPQELDDEYEEVGGERPRSEEERRMRGRQGEGLD